MYARMQICMHTTQAIYLVTPVHACTHHLQQSALATPMARSSYMLAQGHTRANNTSLQQQLLFLLLYAKRTKDARGTEKWGLLCRANRLRACRWVSCLAFRTLDRFGLSFCGLCAAPFGVGQAHL